MTSQSPFTVEAVDYETGLPDLRQIRETVFVQEQNVPLALEWDELDPQCHHVLARDGDGQPIGTGRLTPNHTIGRMAVLSDWRGRGVGDGLLHALLDQARELGWREVSLNAQVSAESFYARHGFLPHGERFVEAGIDHQSMRMLLDTVNPVETREAAIAAMLGVIDSARRRLNIYSRELDPGLLDAPDVVAALRRFATGGGRGGGGGEVNVLLQEPAEPQRALAPLIGLAQRLPSAFAFRAIEEPTAPIHPLTRPTISAAITSVRSATASMAKPGWMRRAARASCAQVSTRYGSAPDRARSIARWECEHFN